MDRQGTVPSVHIYKDLLQACSRRKALDEAKQVYAHMAKHGLQLHRFLADLVVTTMVSCGSFSDGLNLFQKLSHRTVFSWTAIISGYSNAGKFEEAVSCYEQMQQEGVQPDKYTFVSMLKACSKRAELKQGQRIHADIVRHRLELDVFVSSALVSMYAKCGSIRNAENVFSRLSERNLVSWSSMLAGYVHHHQGERALEIYRQMQCQGVELDAQCVVSALQACAMLADYEDGRPLHEQHVRVQTLHRGKELHMDAASMGFATDIFVCNCLISMYAKCGSLKDAEQVFSGMSERDVVSWNAMSAAYAQLGYGEQALQVYEQMQCEGSEPIARTFSFALQACASLAKTEESAPLMGQNVKPLSLQKVKELHGQATRLGIESDSFFCSALISVYAQCGSLKDAFEVFGTFSSGNLVVCNVMLATCAEKGLPEMVLQIFEQMQQEGITPDALTFVAAVQACATLAEKEGAITQQQDIKWESLWKGKGIHAFAARKGFDAAPFVSNTLIGMYAKCGSIVDAEKVFEDHLGRDVVSWNALLAAYAQEADGEMVLQVYCEMREGEVTPDDRTFVTVLQACGTLACVTDIACGHGQSRNVDVMKQVKELHAQICGMGLESNSYICSTLISVYAKCGSIKEAEIVLDLSSKQNLESWNAVLAAYVDQDSAEKSMHAFQKMQEEGFMPDARTFVSALKACGTLAETEAIGAIDGKNFKAQSLQLGKEIHSSAAIRGFETNVFVCNALLSMYGRCGSIKDAEQVFGSLPHPDVVSWNAILTTYTEHGNPEKGLQILQHMQSEGVSRDARTYVTAIQACCILAEVEAGTDVGLQTIKYESLQRAKAIQADATCTGFSNEVFFASSLIRMFAMCGSIKDAELVFFRLREPNVVCWNAMLAAYARGDDSQQALQFYCQMLAERTEPDEVTFLSILEVCANNGATATLERVHQSIVEAGIQNNHSVATSLIHAFCKCARVDAAECLFCSLHEPDLASWTAMIAGYARIGDYRKSVQFYNDMCQAGIRPDKLTFTALLSACSHAGLVDKAIEYFESMTRDHGVAAELEHYGCMIDVAGRAGLYSLAEELLLNMPLQPDLCVWLCLLGTCRKHGNVALGRRAFEGAVGVDKTSASAYVLMSNIYAQSGLWDNAKELDDLREQACAWKRPGFSSIEHEQNLYTFLVGDRAHKQAEQILASLEMLTPEIRGSPN